MKIRKRCRRIGIMGSAQAGKTVFLLSLINHLEAGDLKLGGPGTRRFKELPSKPGPFDKLLSIIPGSASSIVRRKFDYQGLRKHLANKKTWPGKTTDASFFRCRFQRDIQNGRFKRWVNQVTEDEIEFFDFPGERTADVTMIGQSYAEWSDEMFRSLTEDPIKAAVAGQFLTAIKEPMLESETVLRAWKLTLAQLLIDCHAAISPSTFLVDAAGKTPMERIVEKRQTLQAPDRPLAPSTAPSAQEYADTSYAGLQNAEFAPLPENVRRSAPEVAQCYEKHYQNYQHCIVRPFAAHVLSCHALIFLVDLTDVLGSGAHKMNDTQDMLDKLLKCIERGNRFFAVLRSVVNVGRSIFGGKWGFIDRIAFVASKRDKIHLSDRNNIKTLLNDLVSPITKNKGPKETRCFTCSAVDSIKSISVDEQKLLVGRPIRVLEDGQMRYCEPGEGERHVPVPLLPDKWPSSYPWNPEAYQFTNFHPTIPAIFRDPPPQAGLDEIMKYAMDL